jgi:ubiquinone/menaquinone biosynthesis C-methylase UbiE
MSASVSWKSYSAQYDLMAEHNPAYQALLARAEGYFASLPLSPGSVIAEIGAGTGNYSTLAASLCPECQILHIEPDAGMNEVAVRKAWQRGLWNIEFLGTTADSAPLQPSSVDVVVAVHSLYAMPDPLGTIAKIHTWLRPDGQVFACDLGRVLDVSDWFSYLRRSLVSRLGYWKTMGILLSGREVAQQNRRIAQMQRSGAYWTHEPDEYVQVWQKAGFSVLTAEAQYRNYSDLVIAKKPAFAAG